MTKKIGSPNAVVVGALFTLGLLMASYAGGQGLLTRLPSPAPGNSSLSRVVANEAGEIYLSWVSREAQQVTLEFARLTNDGWDATRVISRGSNWFVNWAVLSPGQSDLVRGQDDPRRWC